MWHPFDSLALSSCRLRYLPAIVTAVVLIAIFVKLKSYDVDIRGEGEVRSGIVAFELAGSANEAQPIVNSWKVAGVLDQARCSLHLDFALILSYALLFSYLWTLVARGFSGLGEKFADLQRPRMSRAASLFMIGAMVFALGQWVAGLLDVIENCSLLYMLEEGVSDPWPRIAAAAASLKFVLLLVAGPVFMLSLAVLLGLRLTAAWPRNCESSTRPTRN